MRRLRSLRLGVGVVFTTFAGLSAAACADLFHDTDFPDACEIDADAPGCADGGKVTHGDGGHDASADGATGDSGPPVVIGPDDALCTNDGTMAAERVAHACAWLSACGGALGVNAPSACLTQARMVYDCQVAPARPTIGAAATFWRCVANAVNCDAITACLEPSGPEGCKADVTYVACDNADTTSGAGDMASRISCDETLSVPSGIENCSATGRGCLTNDGTCTVSTGSACTTGCTGTILHSCDEAGVDQGIDCSNFGAGGCAFNTSIGAIGCTAVDSTDGGSECAATSDVTCDENGVAHGCPSGIAETVDCPALTGAVGASACTTPSNTGANTWDVSRACAIAGGCSSADETCGDGGIITACVLGQPATLDCSAAGVSSCVLAEVAGETHAACGN